MLVSRSLRRALPLLALVAAVGTQPLRAQTIEERLAALEARVAELERLAGSPAPPVQTAMVSAAPIAGRVGEGPISVANAELEFHDGRRGDYFHVQVEFAPDVERQVRSFEGSLRVLGLGGVELLTLPVSIESIPKGSRPARWGAWVGFDPELEAHVRLRDASPESLVLEFAIEAVTWSNGLREEFGNER